MNNTQYHADIAAWYKTHGRKDLPWRNTDDAYHIYISEVMLQQTQVSTVLQRYYFPFLERFPTLQALADAPQEAVLKCWEGLGYYSRARNLHKAAQLAAPALPDSVEELLHLPGIGKNTAHAVACFGFGRAVPIMEANVKRVLHRLTASNSMNEAELWNCAEHYLDTKQSFDYNQAMMDIGATICTPKQPKCLLCPVNRHCKGKESPELYPEKKSKKTVPVRKKNIIILRSGSHYHMKPRTTQFLGGLYGFVEIPREDTSYHDISLSEMTLIGGIEQKYSHFTLDGIVYLCDTEAENTKDWHDIDSLKTLPSSKADHKAIALLKAHLEQH